MPKRIISFTRGSYYHVFNRGINRNKIFINESDYLRALGLIGYYVRKYNISIIAYCLMPNHYHFLLRQDREEGLPLMVRDAFNAYAQYFNRRMERQGSLFEGRFKAIWIEDESYLLHLC